MQTYQDEPTQLTMWQLKNYSSNILVRHHPRTADDAFYIAQPIKLTHPRCSFGWILRVKLTPKTLECPRCRQEFTVEDTR